MAVRVTEPVELARGVWRAGTEIVNWYLVEDEGRVTIVDAGVPKFRPQLDVALDRMGRSLGDVAALILTHAHVDHIGFAEPLRAETGVAVHVHTDDEHLATTRKPLGKNERSIVPYLRYPFAYRLLGHLTAGGAGKTKPIAAVTTFGDGDALDVPGRPRVVHTPGHTTGHCSFYLADRGALLIGDEVCTLNPLSGSRGPQLMPKAFNLSSGTCIDSLAKLEDLEADVVLPGHGEPWTDGVPSLVERTRAAGAL
ncbi:MAG TPA: MBL fold metallo-hydrolase [Gaiellaceae bacterium]